MSNGFDVGGDLADIEWAESYRADIQEDRERRLRKIKGKYIIVTDGKKGDIYLQDKRISNKHDWTKFLANALWFDRLEDARKVCSVFKFNNPRVCLVADRTILMKM